MEYIGQTKPVWYVKRTPDDTYLQHYGVRGMKWGVRRDAQLLASKRKKEAVKSAKLDYTSGKTTKEQYKSSMKEAKATKRSTLKDLKTQFRATKTKEERDKVEKTVQNKALKEVDNLALKKKVSRINNAYHNVNIAKDVALAAAVTAISVDLAPLALGVAAATSAYQLGRKYVLNRVIDETA